MNKSVTINSLMTSNTFQCSCKLESVVDVWQCIKEITFSRYPESNSYFFVWVVLLSHQVNNRISMLS